MPARDQDRFEVVGSSTEDGETAKDDRGDRVETELEGDTMELLVLIVRAALDPRESVKAGFEISFDDDGVLLDVRSLVLGEGATTD